MKNFATVFILLFSVFASAQEVFPATGRSVIFSGKADVYVGTDQFGAHYFISNNVFSKYTDGKRLDYNNVSKGNIAGADITNPLLLVLFYKDFNSVVLLDSQLNEIRQISFNDPAIPMQVQATGLASQNRLWLYDSLSQQIWLYDFNAATRRSITPAVTDGIAWYETDLNHFYWIGNSQKLFVSDIFGKVNFLGVIPPNEICRITPTGTLIYVAEGKLYYIDPKKDNTVMIDLPEKSIRGIGYEDQNLFIFTGEGIIKYNIKLP